MLCVLCGRVAWEWGHAGSRGWIGTRDQGGLRLLRGAILAFTGSCLGEGEAVNLKERALAGLLGGVAATLVLSGLREA